MANEEHLAILKQGDGVWNKWPADDTACNRAWEKLIKYLQAPA